MCAMDESAIVQPTTETPTTPDSAIKPGIESNYREFAPLYKHFDVEKSDKADAALEQIWEYCKGQAVNKDKDSVILQVIKFNHELGSGDMDEAPYMKMLRYLKVYKQFEDSGKLLEELKKK
jgi:hypothetical protein